MEYQIERYNRNALKTLVESEEFLSLPVYPISPQRAMSHINNPRLSEEDVLLVMIKHRGEIIGFRCALPDYVFNGEKKIKVAWLSGSWVDSRYRRKGLSTKLLDEIHSAYNEALIFTNYAPISKKLYDKSGLFQTYQDHNGKRFYLRSNTFQILPGRWPMMSKFKWIYKVIDSVFNFTVLPVIVRVNELPKGGVKKCEKLTETQVERLFGRSLCRRGMEEYNWILNYPWVIDESIGYGYKSNRYIFSWISKPYKLYTLSFISGNEEALIMISLKGRTMKIPYYYCSDSQLEEVSKVIFNQAHTNNACELDIFDELLAQSMIKLKNSYILSKDQNRKYVASKSIIDKLPPSDAVKVPDGEGEVVFV